MGEVRIDDVQHQVASGEHPHVHHWSSEVIRGGEALDGWKVHICNSQHSYKYVWGAVSDDSEGFNFDHTLFICEDLFDLMNVISDLEKSKSDTE